MAAFEKILVFVCSGSAKAATKKLSSRIAATLQDMGIVDIGNLQDLSKQHSMGAKVQRKMIFINDCRSGCVNMLTHGFEKDKFIYLDISPYRTSLEFDIPHYIQTEVLPTLNAKWRFVCSAENHTSKHEVHDPPQR